MIASDGKVIGAIAIADPLKESAISAINTLNRMGIHTVMLTGDQSSVANAIAKEIDQPSHSSSTTGSKSATYCQATTRGTHCCNGW